MRHFLMLWSLTLLLAGCADEPGAGTPKGQAANAVPSVYTVNYPLAWMAGELSGDLVAVSFPAPAGEDPAFWEPDVDTILQYQQADLVLLNGANYASWVAKVSLPSGTLVDTSASYRDRLITLKSGPSHSHGPGEEHSHGDLAFTTWLDLELAALQLRAVAAALEKLTPVRSADLEQALERTGKLLAGLDAQLLTLGQALDDAPILFSHPVYQYLQRRYRINGQALHWEPGEMPGDDQWAELEKLLQSHPARLMLWEAEPLPEVHRRLEKMGVQVVVFHPLGNRPDRGDFTSVMADNIDALESALGNLRAVGK